MCEILILVWDVAEICSMDCTMRISNCLSLYKVSASSKTSGTRWGKITTKTLTDESAETQYTKIRVFGESRTVADEHGAIHGANFSYNP